MESLNSPKGESLHRYVRKAMSFPADSLFLLRSKWTGRMMEWPIKNAVYGSVKEKMCYGFELSFVNVPVTNI